MTDVLDDWQVFVIAGLYAIAIVALQKRQVVGPRDWLLARIRDLQRRQDKAEEPLVGLKSQLDRPWPLVRSSTVQAGWRLVHVIEDDGVMKLDSDEVDQLLATARSRLSALDAAQAKALVERIDAVLAADANPSPSIETKRVLLREARVYLHNVSDTGYEDLAGLLAKAVWWALVTLALIVSLSLWFDREAYFFFGAVGAVISRMTRMLRRRPSSKDWGASWATIALSLPAAALMGWIGVLLVDTLASKPFEALNAQFANLWDSAITPTAFIVAVVFGFSERLLDRTLDVAEGTIVPKPAAAAETETPPGRAAATSS